MDLSNLSSNWKNLQLRLQRSKQEDLPKLPLSAKRKRKSGEPSHGARSSSSQKRTRTTAKTAAMDRDVVSNHEDAIEGNIERLNLTRSNSQTAVNIGLSHDVEVGKYIAIDCEMVGIGPDPDNNSALARISLVNYNGDQVYDSYVKPLETVTDWRTPISGISPKHMVQARSLENVQADVSKILKDRIVIGHSVRNDFEALLLSHPKRDIRDTARHPPYRKLAGGGSPRLKFLASEILGLEIQEGEHSSIEDARACMMLFRRDKAAFDQEHARKWPNRPVKSTNEDDEMKSPKRSRKKKKKKRK